MTSERGAGDTRSPWGVLVVAMIFIATLLAPLQVNDLAYGIRLGDWILATHHVPRYDFLTYTVAGSPWIDQQWGAQLIFALLSRAGGWKLMSIMHAALVAGCFGAVYLIGRSRGASAVVAGTATVAGYIVAALVPGALAMRPQLLALPLLIASYWIINTRDARPSRLLVLLPLGVLWANVHGSFPLLSLLLVIAVITDILQKRLATMTVAVLVATLVTPLLSPFGTGTYRYVWAVATSPIVRDLVSEWAPLWSFVPAAIGLVAISALTMLLVRGRRLRPRIRLEDAVDLILFSALAVLSARNVLWWSALAPAIVCGWLVGWNPGAEWSARATRTTNIGAAIAAALVCVASLVQPTELTEAPQGVSGALATMPASERIFNEWWGSWFEYALPDRPTFTDARVELFPDAVWDDYFRVVDAQPGWQDTLRRWHISVVVVDAAHDLPLRAVIERDPCWKRFYADDEGVIYMIEPDCS